MCQNIYSRFVMHETKVRYIIMGILTRLISMTFYSQNVDHLICYMRLINCLTNMKYLILKIRKMNLKPKTCMMNMNLHPQKTWV